MAQATRVFSTPPKTASKITLISIDTDDPIFDLIDIHRNAGNGRQAGGTNTSSLAFPPYNSTVAGASTAVISFGLTGENHKKGPSCCRHTLPEAFGFVPIST
jgi:hypothetical protein